MFFDTDLSEPTGQSCATCHAPEVGFTGPDSNINLTTTVYPGAVHDRFGNRKPPTSAYAGHSPVLYYDEAEEVWVGGMFWDGRASGWTLGDPLAEQAQGPFLNPVEQNLASAEDLCNRVLSAHYSQLFLNAWGADSLDCEGNADAAHQFIGRTIAAYERSGKVDPYSSEFDQFWTKATRKGMDVAAISMENWESYKKLGLDDQKLLGLALFADEDKGKCALCHVLEPGPDGYPLFTDFTYDNLGVPQNPNNPVYLTDPGFIDEGLGAFLRDAGFPAEVYEQEIGKVKVPTLRNVDKRPYPDFVKSFTHNGYFTSLKEVVRFYNTRDLPEAGWPEAEVLSTVNTEELGNLGLSPEEEDLIVLFMTTLSDGNVPPQ